MIDMFDNYDNISEYYIPDNKVKFLKCNEPNHIVIGATNDIGLLIDLSFEDIEDIKFYFSSSLSIFLVKEMQDLQITEADCGTMVDCITTPEDFINITPFRDCFVQAKIKLINGNIIYSKKRKLKIITTLDHEYFNKKEEE